MTTRDRAQETESARTTDRDARTGPLADSGVRSERVPPSDAPTLLAQAPPAGWSQPPPSGSEATLNASPGGAPGSLATGTLLDGVYRVEREIGRGAMGAVYLVEHLRLGRKFAAKVVASGHATNPDIAQRLRNEARVASQIQHENIVDVTHLGQAPDGSLFVVMELLEGRDLRDWIADHREGEIPFADARAIAADVMAGLEVAHEAGIIHRDLKPDNVFLVQKGGRTRAKIVDFGISKSTQRDEDLRLTRTGQIMGTPLYMAPEQTRSTIDVDARADQYSLGVMLYELLTGKLPFEAGNVFEIVVKHATEPPPSLRRARPDVPPAVEAVVLRCLAKRPEDRFESVSALRAAWDAAWTAPEIEVPLEIAAPEPQADARSGPDTVRPGAARASRALPIAIAIALLVGAPLAYFAARPGATEAPVATTPVGADPVAPEVAPPDTTAHEATGRDVPPPEIEIGPTEIAPTEIGAPDPAHVAIRRTLHSEPEGATVRIGERDVGVTPYELELPGGAPIAIELRLRGYRREVHTVSADGRDAITITLRRATQDRPPELAPR